jgi:hypothetical protein
MLWSYEIYVLDQQQLADMGSFDAPDFVEARDRALRAPFIARTGRRRYEVRLLNENGNAVWIGRFQNAGGSDISVHQSKLVDAA